MSAEAFSLFKSLMVSFTFIPALPLLLSFKYISPEGSEPYENSVSQKSILLQYNIFLYLYNFLDTLRISDIIP